jgi:hypothetical protein
MSEEMPLRLATLDELIASAVRIECAATGEDEYEAVWPLIAAMKSFGEDARTAGLTLLRSADATERAVGADLLGQLCNPDEQGWGTSVADALVDLAQRETDTGVLWSIAHACKFTSDPVAGPTLARLASHPDTDVRYQVACALPSCDDEGANASVLLPALFALMEDEDDDVRDWATFGLARQLELDGHGVRAALARNLDDLSEDVRDEAIAGLARRHDRRALEPLRERLERAGPANLVLEAACYLADATLLPALRAIGTACDDDIEQFDATLLNQAIWACDPEHQRAWGRLQEKFLTALAAAITASGEAWAPTLYCPLMELGVEVAGRSAGGRECYWDLWGLLMARSGGSIAAAVAAAMSDIASTTAGATGR